MLPVRVQGARQNVLGCSGARSDCGPPCCCDHCVRGICRDCCDLYLGAGSLLRTLGERQAGSVGGPQAATLRPVPLIIGVQLAAALQIIFSAVNLNLISCRPTATSAWRWALLACSCRPAVLVAASQAKWRPPMPIGQLGPVKFLCAASCPSGYVACQGCGQCSVVGVPVS
jgi:hypothetical protein